MSDQPQPSDVARTSRQPPDGGSPPPGPPRDSASLDRLALASLENADEGLIIVDRDWRVVFANAASERFLQRPRADLLGYDLRALLPDARDRRFGVECRRAVAENVPVAFEEFYPGPLNAWFEVRAFPSAEGLSILFRDITERRRTEEALRQSEERYRALFSSMTEGFAVLESIVDQNGVPCDSRFLEINAAFETLTGMKRDDLLGRLSSEVLPEDNARWVGTYGAVALTGTPKSVDHYSPRFDRHYSVLAFRPAPGQFAIVFHDVTEREQLERERLALLTKYSVLFGSFPLGISVTDAQGRLVEVNEAGAKLLGLSEDEHRRRRIDSSEWRILRADGTPMPPSEFPSVRALGERRLVEGVELGVVRSDGRIAWITVSAAPLPLEDYGVVITYADVSRRREAEAALARSEAALKHANDELSAANEALRNNNETLETRVAERTADLARRTAQLRALARDLAKAEETERRKVAEVIHDQIQQLLSVARIKIEMARGQAASAAARRLLTDVDGLVAESLAKARSLTAELRPDILHRSGLATALAWIGRWYKEQFGLRVVVEAENDPDTDEETRVVLFRSVRELLVNVVKHAKVTNARVRLDTTIDGRARIVVSDTGAGFNPETLRAWDGTTGGFGLLSVRERLEALGGRLDIESAPGEGARFTIVGPPSEHSESRTPDVAPPAPAPDARRRTGARPGARPGAAGRKTRKPGRSG